MAQQRQETKDEFEEKVLFINRCSKVVKGGRKFSFSALILVGNRAGKVGYGFAKANELTDAIRKGGENARKNVITFATQGSTIPHPVSVSWDGAQVMLKPAPEGAGIIAGSYMRSILEFAGIHDIVGKSLGANNAMNVVHATFRALSELRGKDEILEARGAA